LAGFREIEMARMMAEAESENRKVVEEIRKRVTVRDWLSAVNANVEQEIGLEILRSNPGSGSWLLANSHFQSWINLETSGNSILWLTGIPGSGLIP
jgi:hypothetical protein